MKKGVGDQFQEETKYLRNKIEGVVWSKPPDLYKIYPDSKKILLPEPMFSIEKTLDEVLKKRKSIRSFSNIPVSKKTVIISVMGFNRDTEERTRLRVPHCTFSRCSLPY